MLADDLEPIRSIPKVKPLDPMSIDELHAYIAALKDEIARVERAIAAKQAHAASVSSLFKGA